MCITFPRADAYVALHPYLSKLRLPRGVGNMATNRPPNDVDLIAAKASLIVRHDLNPGHPVPVAGSRDRNLFGREHFPRGKSSFRVQSAAT